jgi:hypothetical protein
MQAWNYYPGTFDFTFMTCRVTNHPALPHPPSGPNMTQMKEKAVVTAS